MSATGKMKAIGKGLTMFTLNAGKGAAAIMILPLVEFVEGWLELLPPTVETTTERAPNRSSLRRRGEAKWWKVLGVSETATLSEIKTAYKRRMSETSR